MLQFRVCDDRAEHLTLLLAVHHDLTPHTSPQVFYVLFIQLGPLCNAIYGAHVDTLLFCSV